MIITAVRRIRSEDKQSAKVFKSRFAKFDDKKNFYMRDVGRATSAAPTYFPSAEIKNILGTKEYSLLDGGINYSLKYFLLIIIIYK